MSRFKRNIVNKIISIFLSIIMIISVIIFSGRISSKAAGKYNGRIINVVYDDSGSMVKNSSGSIPRWSQAKYSLEVFAAMLSGSDQMNVYPMSLSGGLGYTLTGTDQNRVTKVHEMNGHYANTPFATVRAAGDALMNDSSGAEKWLVIITDGAFDDGATPLDEVQSTIESYNANDIKVAYLAIGDDASVLSANPTNGFFTEKAADGIDVLTKVTSIANQIFSHMVLPQEYISSNGGSTTLSIDIPTDQIIVFAQGDSVEIGDLSSNGNTIKPTEIENVKYSDVLPENYQDAVVDETLKGVVATFNAGSDPYPEGEFTISVSGAETIEYYYKPGVIVNAELLYDNNPVLQDADLYAGEYDVTMNFINPLTNQPIESKLLSDAVFSLDITNNGETSELGSDHGTINLVEGDVELLATAELPGQVVLTDVKNYTVLPEPVTLNLEFEKTKGSFSADEIAAGTASIKLVVTNAEDGAKLSEEEWNSTTITMSDAGGVTWEVEKGDEVSTWNVIPKSADGTIGSIGTGSLSFAAAADYQIDKRFAHGSGELVFNVLEYVSSDMILEVVSTPDQYSLYNLESEPGIVVRAYIEDEVTKEKNVIDEDLWNAMVMDASSDKKMDFRVEMGSEVGEYVVYPMYYKTNRKGIFSFIPKSHERRALKTDFGDINVSIVGDTASGEMKYHGETVANINVRDLSQMEKLMLWLPVIISLLILFFIILGYIVKKKIPKKRLNPRCILDGEFSPKKKIKKKILSVIIPYVPEEARVNSSDAGYECHFPNLKIKATSKRSFKILNNGIDVKSTLINGESFEDIREIKKRNFSYSGFEITSIDTSDNNREQGSFMFRA